MKTFIAEELKNILDLHQKWFHSEDGGVRADLREANLGGADLREANLGGADLRGAILRGANLWGANLRGANLRGANLRGANLTGADLTGANLREADLREADLTEADLTGANLREAELTEADLTEAELTGAVGDMWHIKSIQAEKYTITYTSNILQIGCQRHPIDEWRNFDDATIAKMDSGALEWWRKWKEIVFKMIELSPCEPTKA